ncbi:MAG: restriction endonuclease subunit S [Desulfobulbaceae bacterium]|jgi:type I restriction enzyme S subunit
MEVREASADYLAQLAPKVTRGYKQTEVGVIPEDWEVVSCRELCVKIQDGTHFSPKIRGNDYLYVTSKNIGFGTLNLENADLINAAQHRAIYKRCDVKVGDLLLTKDGANTGNAAINTLNEEFSLLSSVAFLRFNPTQHSASYFMQQMLSGPGQRQIKDAMSGNAITRLTLEKINNLRFPVAPLQEQHAIAAALSDVDALLNKLDQLIAKNCDLKEAAMQQLLTGQIRLPGFSGEWRTETLSNVIIDLAAGVSVNSSDSDEEPSSGFPCVLKTSALSSGTFLPKECKSIAPFDWHRARVNPRRNTVLISRMNTPDLVGEVGYVGEDYPWLFLPDRVWMTCFRANSGVNARWLAYLLSSFRYKRQIKGTATGTSGSMKNISKKAFLSLPIEFPDEKEQTAIAAVLSDMDAEIAALEARRDKTLLLKQGMMQELLTGRIRLV